MIVLLSCTIFQVALFPGDFFRNHSSWCALQPKFTTEPFKRATSVKLYGHYSLGVRELEGPRRAFRLPLFGRKWFDNILPVRRTDNNNMHFSGFTGYKCGYSSCRPQCCLMPSIKNNISRELQVIRKMFIVKTHSYLVTTFITFQYLVLIFWLVTTWFWLC